MDALQTGVEAENLGGHVGALTLRTGVVARVLVE